LGSSCSGLVPCDPEDKFLVPYHTFMMHGFTRASAVLAGALGAFGFQANQKVILALSSEAGVSQLGNSTLGGPHEVQHVNATLQQVAEGPHEVQRVNTTLQKVAQHGQAAVALLDQGVSSAAGHSTALSSVSKDFPNEAARAEFEKKFNYVFFFYHHQPKYAADYKQALVVLFCLCYTLLAITYSFFKARRDAAVAIDKKEDKKERVYMFDVGRFFLEYVVVGFHSGGMFFPGLKVWHVATVPYRMFGFFLLSGIFGSSMQYESVAKITCVCFVTCIFAIFLEITAAFCLTGDMIYSATSTQMGLWFLYALWLMRVVVTPFFHHMKALGADAPWSRKILSWLIVFNLSYLLSHALPWAGLNAQLSQRSFFFIFYAPYFAVGLFATPGQWFKVYSQTGVRIACFTYWIVFYAFIGGPSNQWDNVYCYRKDCHNLHMPDMTFLTPLSWSGYAMEIEMFVLRTGLMISYFGMIGTFTHFVQTFVPRLASCFAEWGTRTLFSYVLHLTLFGRLFFESGLAQTIQGIPLAGGAKYTLLSIFVMWYNVVLCCSFTERVFRWFCLPFWVKDLLETAVSKLAGDQLMGAKA